MTPQAQRILKHLELFGTDTDSNISKSLSIPAPSVRRSIQELQDAGYPISYMGKSAGYTLARS